MAVGHRDVQRVNESADYREASDAPMPAPKARHVCCGTTRVSGTIDH